MVNERDLLGSDPTLSPQERARLRPFVNALVCLASHDPEYATIESELLGKGTEFERMLITLKNDVTISIATRAVRIPGVNEERYRMTVSLPDRGSRVLYLTHDLRAQFLV